MLIYARIHTLLILSSRLTICVLALLMGVGLSSCHSHDNERHIDRPEVPIAFASGVAEQEALTRATTPLAQDFTVYGYKLVSAGQVQTVFKGYEVKYLEGSANTSEDNTHGYSYVDVTKGQSIKYWDMEARDYHFWGACLRSEGVAAFGGEKGNVLTIPGMKMQVGEEPAEEVLFTALYERKPVTTDVVRLEFMRPYAKVRLQFYTNDVLSGSDVMKLSDIKFGPVDAEAKIYGQGDVVVTYPLPAAACTGEVKATVEVHPNEGDARGPLTFKPVRIDREHGTASNNAVTACVDGEGHEYYYPLPLGALNRQSYRMTAKFNGDPVVREAVVPASYMEWRPNVVYTYIFKITDAKILFYDVQIDPWHYGGSQEEEWKNW